MTKESVEGKNVLLRGNVTMGSETVTESYNKYSVTPYYKSVTRRNWVMKFFRSSPLRIARSVRSQESVILQLIKRGGEHRIALAGVVK